MRKDSKSVNSYRAYSDNLDSCNVLQEGGGVERLLKPKVIIGKDVKWSVTTVNEFRNFS